MSKRALILAAVLIYAAICFITNSTGLFLLGGLGAVAAGFVWLWALTRNLQATPRILIRSIVGGFISAPGILGGTHGALPAPFGVLFFPTEAFASWHLYSAGFTSVLFLVALTINEFLPEHCKKCGSPLNRNSKSLFCAHCETADA